MQPRIGRIHRMWPVMLAAIMLALTPHLKTAQAAPEALNQAPQEADVVILVPNLQALNQKLANLRQNLGLPLPALDDALTSFKQATGMTQGLNDDGPILIALPDLTEALAAQREPQALLLVPVTDYQAFVSNFGGNADEEVAQLTMPRSGQSFGRQAGEFAIIGENREAVQAYQPGNGADAIAQSVGALGQRYLDAADILAYIDMAKVGPALKPILQESIDEMARQMEDVAAMGMLDPATAGNAQAMYRLYGDAANVLFDEATGLVAALDLDDQGIGLTYALAYQDGGRIAQLFPGDEDSDTTARLGSLPQQPYIFAAAVDAQALNLSELYQNLLNTLPQDDNNPMVAMADQWMPLVQNLQGGAMAFYAPGDMGMMGGGLLNTLSVFEVENPDAYVQQLKTYITALNGVEVPSGLPAAEGGEPAAISYTTSYTSGALQLEGQPVDQFSLSTNLPPEMMQQLGPAAGFASMFSNYTGYIAAKDGRVILTTTPDPNLVTQALRGLDGGGIGAEGPVVRIREQALPPQPVAQAYLSLGGIVQTANTFLQMFGGQPVPVPQDLPPITSGLSIEGQSMAYRVYVPAEVLKFAVDTWFQMQAQFSAPQPGPGGPAPF